MTSEARFSLLSFHTRGVNNLYSLKWHTTKFPASKSYLKFLLCYFFLIFVLSIQPHIAESLEYDSTSTNQDFSRKTRARQLPLSWVVSTPHPLSYIFKIYFNITHRSTPISAMWSSSSRYPNLNPLRLSLLPQRCGYTSSCRNIPPSHLRSRILPILSTWTSNFSSIALPSTVSSNFIS
jgi:hypothetical protein